MRRTSLLVAALLGWLLVASAIAPAAHAQCTRESCNDGNLCTTEVCNPTTGLCETTSTVNCSDNNACTTETCNPATGQCQLTGTVTCNDFNLCSSEACKPSTGLWETWCTSTCNDDNVCTTDVCNPTTGACQTASNWCGGLSDLALIVASRGSKFTFKRKKGGRPPEEYIKVTMSQTVLTTTRSAVPEKVKVGLKAILTGEEAQLASLVYPLAKLAHGDGAATDLQNSGWDFDVIDTSKPCQDVLSSDECAALAHQLSKTIDASLTTAPADERAGFRNAAGMLGVPPDDCIFVP
jgi:hypothetical protein